MSYCSQTVRQLVMIISINWNVVYRHLKKKLRMNDNMNLFIPIITLAIGYSVTAKALWWPTHWHLLKPHKSFFTLRLFIALKFCFHNSWVEVIEPTTLLSHSKLTVPISYWLTSFKLYLTASKRVMTLF